MTQELQHKWECFTQLIRSNVGQQRFDTWFAEATPKGFDGHELTIGLPSHFFYEKYEDDFYNIIAASLKRAFGPGIKLAYEINVINHDDKSRVKIESPEQSHVIQNKITRQATRPVNPLEDHTQAASGEIDPQLNESLNFSNYCVGESNRLPFTIAEYIANNPHKSDFNPFFLYGDVGVGKTHLIQAIGIRIKEKNPAAKVLFLPMRQFQYLLAGATIKKEIPGFINWFQQMDALLFDDLQELSSKEGTMNVLFPIFNHLHQRGKTLVFTCDRPPVELYGITDRLIDRFNWGVTEKLPRPDVSLRKRILHYKASKNGLDMPDEVLDYIAETTAGSVRELEGIVMGILTRSITLNVPISLEMARSVMRNSVKPIKKTINFDIIVDATAEHYGLNPDVIFSKSRVREIADARMVAMYLGNKLTELSLKAIGRKLNRTHTTVMHGISAVKDRMPFARELSEAVEAIEAELRR